MSAPKAVQIVTDSGETYSFIWDDKNKVEVLRELGRMAADPAISFGWRDAAIVSKKIQKVHYCESVCKDRSY